MPIKKFQYKNAFPIEWEGIEARSYTSEEDLDSASAIVFEVNGNHGKVKSTVSDRVYYVIEGKGKFVTDKQEVLVKATDVILVPKNTPYDYQGEMKLFLVHVPAFDPNGEVLLEKKKGREEI